MKDQIAAQGPHCPMIDQQLLRHCLLCAKKLKRERVDKDASVQKLLSEARQALGVSHRGLAERLFLRALVVDPGNTKPYFLYALQVQRRDPDLARALFRTGLSKDPKNAKILQAWGLFESKQGQLDVAQRLLKRSVYLEPLHAPVLKWKVLFPKDEQQKGKRKTRNAGGPNGWK